MCLSVCACAFVCCFYGLTVLLPETSTTVKHTSSQLLTRRYSLYVSNLFAFDLDVNVVSVRSCVVAVRPSFHSSSSFR